MTSVPDISSLSSRSITISIVLSASRADLNVSWTSDFKVGIANEKFWQEKLLLLERKEGKGGERKEGSEVRILILVVYFNSSLTVS